MKSAFKSFRIFLLLCGVFGAKGDEVKSVSVMEGESVTLDANLAQIKTVYRLEWRFGNPIIAQIDENEISYPNRTEFRDRLQLDLTGSLTIKNMKIKHSGLYDLEISHSDGTLYEKFSVTVNESSASEAGKAEIKSLSLMEGESVTLQPGVTKLRGDELIVWRFGDEGKLIAKADIEDKSSLLYYDERFRDRLKIDDQTGSLTITNTRNTDSGLYTVKISSKQTLYKTFTVAVSVPVREPDPGLSAGAIAGIVIGVVLLVAAAAAAAVAAVIYFRRKISELQKQILSVTEGDDVTLYPHTRIQTEVDIQWMSGDTLIAEIKGGTGKIYDGPDARFRNRLVLDQKTGSLTIRNIRAEHTGNYKLKITRGKETLINRFKVYVIDEERNIAVMKGDSVPLKPDTEIHKDDLIQWLFGDEKTLIAEIRGETRVITTYDGPDGRFRNRLMLDQKTGSLTIRNIRAEHTGDYKLKITRGKETLINRFNVYMNDEERNIEVKEGEPVTLKPKTKIHKDDKIRWMFGNKKQLSGIAELSGKTGQIFTYDYVADGKFRGILELDKTTGSLKINNIRTAHTGLYKLDIRSSSGFSQQTFTVTVKVEEVISKEDSVTLNPDTEIQRDDQILWMFGQQYNLIAQIKEGTEKNDYDERFRGRLELDKKTASLTITNIEAEHSGLYKVLIIRSSGTTFKKFNVVIQIRYESVIAGEPVLLYTGLPQNQTNIDEIQWMFGDENSLIAEIKGDNVNTYDGPGGIFRNRLELKKRTGNLTIKNSTAKDAGHYKLKIHSRSEGNTYKTYIVIIRGAVVTDEERTKSLKEKDSTGNRVNESAIVEMQPQNEEVPDGVTELTSLVNVPLNKCVPDGVNEQEGMSSL